jgi:hypothetical protein
MTPGSGRWVVAVGLALGGVAIVSDARRRVDAQALTATGDLSAGGAFTCELILPGSVVVTSPEPIGATLERDRMLMARRTGMIRKHIPLSIDPATGHLQAGGRYLFDTAEHAEDYRRFVTEEFEVDGVPFLERPIFLEHDCHAWRTIGARDFSDVHTTHVVLRTERWRVPNPGQAHRLQDRWPSIRREAGRRGLTSVWLLYNARERLAALVYFATRVGPTDGTLPDVASLGALQSAPPLGEMLSDLPYEKVLDRTQWSWTIWFPFLRGEFGQSDGSPRSPPFPQPFSGDGVCQASRGETAANSPADCGAACGNGTCQLGEGVQQCPGDCGYRRRDD